MQTTIIGGVLFVGLVLLQNHKSFTADEVYELSHLSRNWGTLAARPDGFPPLYSWLLGQFAHFAATSNARLLSAVTATVGLFFVASAGRTISPTVGTRAALFYAVSACQLEYAQQTRAYSLYICCGAIVIYAAINAIYRQRFFDWLMLVLGSTAILWTHYYAATYLVGVWLGLLALNWNRFKSSQPDRQKFVRNFLFAACSSVLLLIFWFHPLMVDLQNPPPAEAINPVDWTGLAYTYLTLIHGWCVGPSQLELFEWSKAQAVLAIAPWAVFSAGLFVIIAYFACRIRPTTVKLAELSSTASETQQTNIARWLLIMVVGVPMISAGLALASGSSFVARYMAVLVVPTSLFFGLGSSLDRLSWRAVASWGLLILNVYSTTGRNFNARYDRENYRELVAFLKSQDQSPQLVVLSHYLGKAVLYHCDNSIKISMVGLNSDEPDDWERILPALESPGASRLWVAADWMRPDDLRLRKKNKILAELQATHVKRISGTIEVFRAELP